MQKPEKHQQDSSLSTQQHRFNGRLSALGRLRYCIWLSSMGFSLIAGGMTVAHAAPVFGSAAWFAQSKNYKPPVKTGNTNTPAGSTNPNLINNPAQARVNTQRTIANLGQAIQAINSAQKSQSAAQQLILGNAGSVPNGLGKGGLQVAAGVGQDASLWQNANAPTQQVKDGQTTVEIKQTAAKSILTWETFNVGQKTTVHFDQTDGNLVKGGNEWVSLNRINNPASKPSEILGSIKAEGTVYLLNPNGVIFGNSAKVDTHSLVVSSLDLFSHDVTESNKAFVEKGLLSITTGQNLLIGGTLQQEDGGLKARDAIRIEKGASIKTGKNGFSLIVAPEVSNAGSITAQDGQVILAAANTLTATGNVADTLKGILNPVVEDGGNLVNTGIIQSLQGNITLLGKNISQNGIVGSTTSLTRQGSIDIRAQESIGGGLTPSRTGYLEFGKNSLTTVLLSDNGETTTSSETSASVVKPSALNISAGAITFSEGALLLAPGAKLNLVAYFEHGNSVPDRPFVTGRIFMDKNAVINVAGMPNVVATEDALLSIPRIGLNELANSPLLRDSFLYTSKDIVVDTDLQGTREDGTSWIGSPLLNIKGYKDQKARKIDELMINGGTVNLVGNEVLVKQGADINIDGGYVVYPESGNKNTTRLITANGQIQDIGSADPNVVYAGVAGVFEVDHARANRKDVFINPVLSGQLATARPAYIVGGNGGELNIFARNSLFLDGNLHAHAYAGLNQVVNNNQPKGGKLTINNNQPDGIWNKGLISGGLLDSTVPLSSSLVFKSQTVKLSERFNKHTSLDGLKHEAGDTSADNLRYWSAIDSDLINQSGLSQLFAYAHGGRILVTDDTRLNVANGGSINFRAHQIQIDGQLKATAGQVNLSTMLLTDPVTYSPITGGLLIPAGSDLNKAPKTDIVVGNKAVIDVSGQWVNDSGATQAELTGSQFIHGGKISMSIASNSVQGNTESGERNAIDKTGSIYLKKDSLLDVSSGGYVQSNGKIQEKNGIPTGNAGEISLKVYDANKVNDTNFEYVSAGRTNNLPNSKPTDGHIQLDGNLRGYGFNHGAKLTLQALNIVIGDQASNTKGTLNLKPELFGDQGFASYDLNAMYDNKVSKGTQLLLSHKNRIGNLDNLLQAKTGSNLNLSSLTSAGRLDDFHRDAGSLSLSAGQYHLWGNNGGADGDPTFETPRFNVPGKGSVIIEKNAVIKADAQASIQLKAVNQIRVDGKIIAPGGNIALDADQGTLGYFPKFVTQPIYLGLDKGVWLGQHSVLDVSGTTLLDTLAKPVVLNGVLTQPKTGKVLNGGVITISNDGGFIAALPGARLNVSGTQDSLDVAKSLSPRGELVYGRQTLWSDAGTINLAASSGLFFDGIIQANGGAKDAQGGSLNIRAVNGGINTGKILNGDTYNGAKAIVLSQSDSVLSELAGIEKTGDIPEAAPGVIRFDLDRLKNTGIDSLSINSNPDLPLAGQVPAPLYFAGNINLSLARSFIANASYYTAIAASTNLNNEPAAITSGYHNNKATQVNIQAPYVQLSGLYNSDFAGRFEAIASRGNSSMNINAGHLDLVGTFGLANFAKANLQSTGDIRFINNYVQGVNSKNRLSGVLYSAGDLNFNAAQLYPATATKFMVIANAQGVADGKGNTETTISIGRAKGSTAKPVLSAGGSLKLDADHINQAGVIKAPLGEIVLGVSQPQDQQVKTAWDKLPLTTTLGLNIKANSVTSVSLEGQIVPYGQTIDDKQWQFNDVAGEKAQSLDIAPSKRISLNADDIDLQKNAVIDLSGSGDLQASEWIAGTGGTRDVLSQFNTSYETGKAQQVALYPDQREVYAIIPGFDGNIAAFDPTFSQSVSHNLGKQVYLSGIDGLPAGIYTLLPAKYATLPNAYRVVQRSSTAPVIPAGNMVMADGTAVVSGYFVDGLSGAHQASNSSFEVQSHQVWRQYSEYNLTSANRFFDKAGLTPNDAGQLVLNASKNLQLGAQLNTQAQQNGVKAQIDISSQSIQIVANKNTPSQPGKLTLSVDDINQLSAGSLLIGGIRENTKDGVYVQVTADEVRVANNAQNPLIAPELILTAKGSNAEQKDSGGIQVTAGSVIKAQGELNSNTQTLIIGRDANADTNIEGVSGEGALLRISNAGATNVIRHNLDQDGAVTGLMNIAANAVIDGGKSLTLNTSANTLIDDTVQVSAKDIAIDSGRIGFGQIAEDFQGFAVTSKTLSQFEKAEHIRLRSYDSIDFFGDVNVTSSKQLTLSAATLNSDGGKVNIHAEQFSLSNELQAQHAGNNTNASATKKGTLNIQGTQLVLGAGDKQMSGFGKISLNAKTLLALQDSGSLNAGNAALVFKAPVVRAALGASQQVKTANTLLIQSSGQPSTVVSATAADNLGGRIELIASSINHQGVLQAKSGQISLTASSGNINLQAGSLIDVSGVKKPFYDTQAYAPAGRINLTATKGNISLQEKAVLDFSAATEGGNAGRLTLSAPQAIQLQGQLKGQGLKGQGGEFQMDSGHAVDLNQLSDLLASSGVNQLISIRSLQNDLTLNTGKVLSANTVELIADADNGSVNILGKVDASGKAGGNIRLSGREGVNVEGQLIASGTDKTQRGGQVVLASSGTSDGSLNEEHGYQNIDSKNAGKIRIASSATIDVSGGSAGGLSGGTLAIRTPLLKDGDINLSIESGAQIKGSRETAIEAYAVWSTTDQSKNPAQHFDGIIDPAGWYDQQGKLLAGTFSDDKGNVIASSTGLDEATLSEYLRKYVFTPDSANLDHQTFYGYLNGDATLAKPGTLMGFIQKPGFTFSQRLSGIENLVLRPGIELQNPSKTINNGTIQVLTPWNLAAGRLQNNTPQLDYRFNGVAPVLSLRADTDIKMQASISDGFFQFNNPFGSGGVNTSTFGDADGYYYNIAAYIQYNYEGQVDISQLPTIDLPHNVDDNPDTEAAGQYYTLYQEYLKLLTEPSETNNYIDVYGFLYANPLIFGEKIFDGQPVAPTPATTTAEYPAYLQKYTDYMVQINEFWAQTGGMEVPKVQHLLPPPTQLEAIKVVAPINNTPSPTMQAGNMLPQLAGELIQSDSSSYRMVAGASFNSANPGQLKTGSTDSSAAGSIIFSGSQSVTANFQNSDLTVNADRTLVSPTMLRTGVGSIELNALNDLKLDDAEAPAVIYSAGTPTGALNHGTKIDKLLLADATIPYGAVLVNGLVNPEAAGDIRIQVGRDIISSQQVLDNDGMQTGTPGTNLGQYWWQWMQTGNEVVDGKVTRSSINFANFKQGIMSIGGQVNIAAGRDIHELAVSLPTTWYMDANGKYATAGGGNLNVLAGNNILSGSYFVSKGTGNISALGKIASGIQVHNENRSYDGAGAYTSPLATLLALQDANINVNGISGVDIGGIYNPSTFESESLLSTITTLDRRQYSQQSAVNINSVAQDVSLNTLKSPAEVLFASILSPRSFITPGSGKEIWLPASLGLTAFSGSVNIAGGGHMTASPSGNLNILASRSIRLSNPDALNSTSLRMGDVYTGEFNTLASNVRIADVQSYDAFYSSLHKNDQTPARIYSLTGNIDNGMNYAGGASLINGLNISIPKMAQIYAGQDIVNLAFYGQNLHKSDITKIMAGRDIINTAMIPVELVNSNASLYNNPSVMSLAGSGHFSIQAGRNIGPLTNASDTVAGISAGQDGLTLGIVAVGNQSNQGFNPEIPRESADINIYFGVAQGIAVQAFINQYINPQSAAIEGLPRFNQQLIDFVSEFNAGKAFNTGYVKDQAKPATLSVNEAWAQFQKLPEPAKQLLVDRIFTNILAITARDYNNPASPYYQQYVRGYQAINTLYPAKNGYTQNNLLGGENGAATLKETGDLDIRATTVQTQQGGDINIYGPGGRILVGGNTAAPLIYNLQGALVAGPSKQGIMALEQGNINIFADQSILLAQSRIFTQQGGNMLIWSSNGDINAGKGAKTTSELPPAQYLCTFDMYCYVDSKAQVSGAGIAALQTVAGGKPGDVYLAAPRGTVDAGDAGIRVAGTIYVAAQQVASADNFQVQGESVGVPTVAQIDTTVLSAANAAVASVVQQAMNMNKPAAANKADTMITVDILNVDNNGF